MEELRQDLPLIRDRHDLEAQIMQQATDPQTEIITLNVSYEGLGFLSVSLLLLDS